MSEHKRRAKEIEELKKTKKDKGEQPKFPPSKIVSVQNELVPTGNKLDFHWRLVATFEDGRKLVICPSANHKPKGLEKRRHKAELARENRKRSR